MDNEDDYADIMYPFTVDDWSHFMGSTPNLEEQNFMLEPSTLEPPPMPDLSLSSEPLNLLNSSSMLELPLSGGSSPLMESPPLLRSSSMLESPHMACSSSMLVPAELTDPSSLMEPSKLLDLSSKPSSIMESPLLLSSMLKPPHMARSSSVMEVTELTGPSAMVEASKLLGSSSMLKSPHMTRSSSTRELTELTGPSSMMEPPQLLSSSSMRKTPQMAHSSSTQELTEMPGPSSMKEPPQLARSSPVLPPETSLSKRKQRFSVEIIKQPAYKVRFRYLSELNMRPRPGCIPSRTRDKNKKKSFVEIRIKNLKEARKVLIVASCVTKNSPYRMHPHKLFGKNVTNAGMMVATIKKNKFTLDKVGIMRIPRRRAELLQALQERAHAQVPQLSPDTFPLRYDFNNTPEFLDALDLKSVRLAFQVFVQDDGGSWEELEPVVTDPIHNDTLEIKHYTLQEGKASGDDDLTIQLSGAGKVTTKNLEVLFFETNDQGEIVWKEPALKRKIWTNGLIVVKTPCYDRQPAATAERVRVQFQVTKLAKDGNEQSSAKDFYYKLPYSHSPRLQNLTPPPELEPNTSSNKPALPSQTEETNGAELDTDESEDEMINNFGLMKL